MIAQFKNITLAVALGATALVVSAPAEAQRYGGYRGRDNGGTAIIAGVAGLAIGAAIASSANRRDEGYAYDRGYDRPIAAYPQGYDAYVEGYPVYAYRGYDGYDGYNGYNGYYAGRGGHDRGGDRYEHNGGHDRGNYGHDGRGGDRR
ncbi:hypothetical protein BH10PSE15_BH10PSE15_04880 [soil metagenome]